MSLSVANISIPYFLAQQVPTPCSGKFFDSGRLALVRSALHLLSLIMLCCAVRILDHFSCSKRAKVVRPSDVKKNPNIIIAESDCTVKLVEGKYILTDHINAATVHRIFSKVLQYFTEDVVVYKCTTASSKISYRHWCGTHNQRVIIFVSIEAHGLHKALRVLCIYHRCTSHNNRLPNGVRPRSIPHYGPGFR